MALRVLSILGGRPHLVKCSIVHQAFDQPDVQHDTVECWLGPLSDSPQTSTDFPLPIPLAVVREDSPGRLAGRLLAAATAAKPHVILLYGDLDVTLIGLGVAQQLGVPTVHVESGYRTGDLADREEFTRVAVSHGVTHRVVFTASMEDNLRAEGIDPRTISRYGNPIVQSLAGRLPELGGTAPSVPSAGPDRGLALFHREETVLDPARLHRFIDHLEALATRFAMTVVLFRRADLQLRRLGIRGRLDELAAAADVKLTSTLRYADYVGELSRASFVLTDSSTIQDECAFLRTECFVLRPTSPRAADFPSTTRLVDSVEPADLLSLVTAATRERRLGPPDPARLGPAYDASFAELLRGISG